MDVFLVIICIVMAVILTIVAVYIMAFYTHADQQLNFVTTLCKIIIVISLIQCSIQQLLLALDAANSRGSGSGFNMNLIWTIFYISVFINLGLLVPFAVFIYQSDQQKTCCQRGAITIFQVIITVGVICIICFISYIYLNQANIPIQTMSTDILQSMLSNDSLVISSKVNVINTTIDIEIGIPYYLMGIMCFFGYIILVLCGGCGLSALPLDLIMQFRMRPRWLKTSQGNKKKQQFKQIVSDLIATGQKIKKKMKQADYETGWWNRRKYNNNIIKQFEEYQSLVLLNNQSYQLFMLQLSMASTNPFLFIFKLILGIFSIFISLIWWIQMQIRSYSRLFSQLITRDGKPFLNFLDKAFLYFQANNANFVSVLLFIILTQYLVFCILKGSFTFGLSVPFLFSFHPMKQGRTWMNSFLFNISLSVLGCISIVHICANCFPQYSRNTVIQLIFVNQINHLKIFKFFFQKKIFMYAFIIWSALISIFIIIRGVKQPQLLKIIRQKRNKLHMKPIQIEMQELKQPLAKSQETKSNRTKLTVKSKKHHNKK